jgi:FkbM family methyltransferase
VIRYLRLFKNVSNGWLYLLVKTGIAREDPLVFRLPNRVRLEVPRRLLHEFKEIFMEECYSREVRRALPDRPVVVDVGANVGFFSFFVASRYPGASIVAVEPSPGNFRQLVKNADLNPHVPIRPLQGAVYGRSGKIALSYETAGDYTTAASVFAHPATRSETLEVDSYSLEDLLATSEIQRCHLMKMDCEGAEYDTLYKCPPEVLARFDQMVIEVHRAEGPTQNIDALARFLSGSGFETRRSGDILFAGRRHG